MERIRRLAARIVQRACAFGLLAIFATSIAFIDRPWLAAQCVSVGLSLMACVLILRGRFVRSTDWRHSEIWAWARAEGCLPHPVERAPAIFAEILAEAYGRYARMTLTAALLAWVVTGGLWLTDLD